MDIDFKSVKLEMIYKMANAPMRKWPYAHFYLNVIFPDDFYRLIRDHLPPEDSYESIADTSRIKKNMQTQYDERFIVRFNATKLPLLPEPSKEFWTRFTQEIFDFEFTQSLLGMFNPYYKERIKGAERIKITSEALLVRDRSNYAIGPHTDHWTRILSLLFYLPTNDALKQYGTSLYLPKDRKFTCGGDSHWEHKMFDRIYTAPYMPNSLLAFVKTDHSFHGVEKIEHKELRRDMLLFDIRFNKDSKLHK